MKKYIYILLSIIDIEAHAEGRLESEILMEWLSTVMSDTDTYSLLGKDICHITRMSIREGKREYPETVFWVFWTDKSYLMRKHSDLRQSIFDKIFFV